MEILIINPPVRLDDKPRHIPHGLAILANIIRKKMDIEPTFLDINGYRYSDQKVKEIIENTNFDIVLIGGIASTYSVIVKLSKLIKEVNPDAKIIAGGYVAMATPEVLLRNSEIDIVSTGEGEITAIELLNKLKKNFSADLKDVLGICYKEKDKKITCTPLRPLIKNLDKESDLPAYDLLPMEIYLSNPAVGIGREIDFISSRGCPYYCTFCYQPWGHRPRAHSIDFIINAIGMLKEKYNIDFIAFQDDEFMADTNRVREFCEKKKHYFPDLLWSCTGRVNIIAREPEIMKTMKDAGCVSISYGFESGSQRMLNSMRKGITVKQMEKVIKVSRENEMPIPASFIIGMPGETKESCKETLDFSLRNNILLDSLMFATPYPGSEIFNFALRTGRIKREKLHEFLLSLKDARDFTINLTDEFTDEELITTRKYMIEKARENYEKFITKEEIIDKIKKLFGNLIEKYPLDEKDWEHRSKHGGMNIF